MRVDYIGYALAVLSLIYAYYLHRQGIRIKDPVYSIKSNNLISGSVSTLENLNITYKDYRVENLTVSKIIFFNRGAETITQQDIVTINRLRISSESLQILDSSILQVNNPSNNFQVHFNKDNQNVYIDFDYLDKNQGAVIQVIHTGLSSEDLLLQGDIKGVQKLTQVEPKQLTKTTPITAKEMRFYVITTAITLIGFYFLKYPNDLLNSILESKNGFMVLVSLSITLAFLLSNLITFLLLPLIIYISVFPSANAIPNSLEKFDE